MMKIVTPYLGSSGSKRLVVSRVRTMSATCDAPNGNRQKDVLFEEVGDKGLIVLNRSKALNTLNLGMVNEIHSILGNWERTKNAVIVKSSSEKAFCAGGDVKSIVLALKESGGEMYGHEFFKNEYRLNHCIATYKKPFVSLIHGIVMGGGVGLSVHGKYRVATDNTLFAMPETAIGLCPDVGATYFLPRLQGMLGLYMGLTGHRFRGIDVMHAGIATHYVPIDKFRVLTEALLAPGSRDVGEILDEFQTNDVTHNFSLRPHIERINECFSAETVDEIINRLKKDGTDWSKDTLRLLSKMSPTALKLTKMAIDKGRDMSLSDCLTMEYRLSCSVLNRDSDFTEGVRALLIDKDQQPAWNPKTLEDVSDEQVMKFFTKIPVGGDLTF